MGVLNSLQGYASEDMDPSSRDSVIAVFDAAAAAAAATATVTAVESADVDFESAAFATAGIACEDDGKHSGQGDAFGSEVASVLHNIRAALASVIDVAPQIVRSDTAAMREALEACQDAVLRTVHAFFAKQLEDVEHSEAEALRRWEQRANTLEALLDDVPAVASGTRAVADAVAAIELPEGERWHLTLLSAVEERDATALRASSHALRMLLKSPAARYVTYAVVSPGRDEQSVRTMTSQAVEHAARATMKHLAKRIALVESRLPPFRFSRDVHQLVLTLRTEVHTDQTRMFRDICQGVDARAILRERCDLDVSSFVLSIVKIEGISEFSDDDMSADTKRALDAQFFGPDSVTCSFEFPKKHNATLLRASIVFPDSDIVSSLKSNGALRVATAVLFRVQFGYKRGHTKYFLRWPCL
jgi:hypothetical protein